MCCRLKFHEAKVWQNRAERQLNGCAQTVHFASALCMTVQNACIVRFITRS